MGAFWAGDPLGDDMATRWMIVAFVLFLSSFLLWRAWWKTPEERDR